jgi:hypothetical protein
MSSAVLSNTPQSQVAQAELLPGGVRIPVPAPERSTPPLEPPTAVDRVVGDKELTPNKGAIKYTASDGMEFYASINQVPTPNGVGSFLTIVGGPENKVIKTYLIDPQGSLSRVTTSSTREGEPNMAEKMLDEVVKHNPLLTKEGVSKATPTPTAPPPTAPVKPPTNRTPRNQTQQPETPGRTTTPPSTTNPVPVTPETGSVIQYKTPGIGARLGTLGSSLRLKERVFTTPLGDFIAKAGTDPSSIRIVPKDSTDANKEITIRWIKEGDKNTDKGTILFGSAYNDLTDAQKFELLDQMAKEIGL